jgi:hypothetical protein
MALLAPIDGQRIEVQQFVARMFRQMHRQQTDARDFSERMALITGALLHHILPGAWGAIPPITQTGRHAAIDDYLARNPWRPPSAGDCLLDLGCGFPPVTTLETAERFPQVSIVGADPSFGEYLVREATGDYAVFDATGSLLYFQPTARVAERWRAMFVDPALTRGRFAAHLAELRAHLPDTTPISRYVSADGVEIIRNPIAGFERPDVKFRRLGIGGSGLQGFTAARCFNVVCYSTLERDGFHERAVELLISNGYRAWVNCVGHIAVDPLELPCSTHGRD